MYSKKSHISGVYLFFTNLITYLNLVCSQTPIFLRDCNNLPGVPGNDYCTAAACGTGATASCNSFGLCQCDYPGLSCGTTVPSPAFMTDFCPTPAGVPPDVPEALAGCMDSCPQICAGGIGEICSLSTAVDVDTYLAICTCSCPPPPCPNITTTTAAPGIVLLPNLLAPVKLGLKVKKKVGLSLIALLFPLILKLIGLLALKWLAACGWLLMEMEGSGLMGWGGGWRRSIME